MAKILTLDIKEIDNGISSSSSSLINEFRKIKGNIKKDGITIKGNVIVNLLKVIKNWKSSLHNIVQNDLPHILLKSADLIQKQSVSNFNDQGYDGTHWVFLNDKYKSWKAKSGYDTKIMFMTHNLYNLINSKIWLNIENNSVNVNTEVLSSVAPYWMDHNQDLCFNDKLPERRFIGIKEDGKLRVEINDLIKKEIMGSVESAIQDAFRGLI